jgi:vitamin B12 transporter
MEWEGQQQDASQETCLLRRVSNFREKRFGYGKFYTFLPILLRLFYCIMKKKVIHFGVFALLFCMTTYAQEVENQLKEVVISDSKFALAKEKSGKVIVKITADELAKKPGQSIASILSTVVGVEINGNQSSGGKNLGTYIRGGRNHQTLIIIDGVPVTDASGVNLEYDLRYISAEQVESIEVMKGAASTLYGSGAATGVINITLKKASKKNLTGNTYFSLGTQTTADEVNYRPQDFNQGVSLNGTIGKINYLAMFNSVETKGISEAQGIDFETDQFSKIAALMKIGFKPNTKFSFDLFTNFDKIKNNYDGFYDNFTSADTPLNVAKTQQFRFGFSPKYKYKNGELVLNSGFSINERNYTSLNTWSNSIDNSSYISKSVSIDAFNKYNFSNQFFLILGSQFQFNEMDSQAEFIAKQNAKFNWFDTYVTAVYNSDFGLNINAGARYDKHSIYNNYSVYNINPSYSISNIDLKLIASYSTAYITPSLYQLFSPYGNLALTPEKNNTIELGFEKDLLNKKIQFNTVCFYREENNSIGFYTDPVTFASNYVNSDGSYNAKGIESMVSYVATNNLKFKANYTFTEVEEPLKRLIPKHKANVSIDYDYSDKATFNLSYQYVDSRKDVFFDGGTYQTVPIQLDSYQLLNAMSNFKIIKNRFNFFASVNNILNANFTENIGYSTRGRNFKIGINIIF